jgi:fumarate hydratase subunit beta
MVTYRFKLPISEEQVRKLRVNDVVYLSGTMVTARDQAHRRALAYAKEGKPFPLDIGGLAVFHCGPIMSKQDGQWVAVAAGPTTSTRLDVFEEEFIEAFKPRVVIGKGGMGKRSADAMSKYGVVYCAFTGGAAVLAAKSIQRVIGVEWLELGMPEAMWVFEVKDFGPLVVAIDSCGGNLFEDVSRKVEANRKLIYEKFGL